MRIGIIGAGQLGRMLARAGYPLGLGMRFLDTSPDSPGGQVGDIVLGTLDDRARIEELAADVDLLTFEVENVPAEALANVGPSTPFYPPMAALSTAQDRLSEKRLFDTLGIATTRYRTVDDRADLDAAIEELGLPCVLKTRRLGYDGRGQRFIRENADADAAFEAIGGVPLIAEEFVAFEREVSAIGVRSTSGEIAMYPLSENRHEDGILRVTTAPADDGALADAAADALRRIIEHFDYVGVLTVEFFVRDGALVANEMAPRVHNSGHWTIEGAMTSQFENHVRAIVGLPLGGTTARGHLAMVNFLGTMPDIAAVLAIPGTHYHDYGKSPRPGRKLGHCTIVARSRTTRDATLDAVRALL